MSHASGYTPEFKARVRTQYTREVHPELDDILEGRGKHAWDIGKILKEGSLEYTISPEHVLAIESMQEFFMLQTKAQMIVDRNKLYSDWLDNAPGVNIGSQEMAREWIAEKKAPEEGDMAGSKEPHGY